MPVTRYVREFTDGVLTAEIPYEVSDEQLEAELETQAREEAIQEITDKKKVEIKARKKDAP